jgi:beta-N-acetylhexosaminidase
MKKVICCIFLIILLIVSTVFPEPGFWEEKPDEKLISRLLEVMTDKELLGQVLMFGYYGTSPSRSIMNFIRNYHIGGIKIFGWNVDGLSELVESISVMQKAAQETSHKIPLFIATDQEGGWVRHVKGETSITPGNLAIGASNLPYDAYKSGYYIGLEIKALGINMNFAPTVDVYKNPSAHVIGPRAFSDDPVETAKLSVAYFHGMEDAGIICTAKHFPGHGNADKDSHGALPIIKSSFEDLWQNDLVPYRFLVREGIPAIMSGHLAFPNITGDNTPSSLSAYFQTEVLREKLDFDGILLTDDLRMHGVTQTGLDATGISRKALSSGVDMIMMSGPPEIQQKVCEELLEAMKKDPAFKKRIKEAVKRILKVKFAHLKTPESVPLFPDSSTISQKIPNREGQQYFFDLACRSVTVIHNNNIPFTSTDSEKILLAGQYKEFLQVGKDRYPHADTFYFSYSPFYYAKDQEKRKLIRMAEDYDTIIFCLSNPNSLEILKELQEVPSDIIVFSVLTPIYLRETPWVSSSLAVYGVGEESFKAGFAVLAGDYKPEGNVPIDMYTGE